MVKDLQEQGIDPHTRMRELEMWIRLLAEERDLDYELPDARLSQKLAIGRRQSELINQQLRFLRVLFKRTADV